MPRGANQPASEHAVVALGKALGAAGSIHDVPPRTLGAGAIHPPILFRGPL